MIFAWWYTLWTCLTSAACGSCARWRARAPSPPPPRRCVHPARDLAPDRRARARGRRPPRRALRPRGAPDPAGELLVGHADVILDRLATAESQLEALAGSRAAGCASARSHRQRDADPARHPRVRLEHRRSSCGSTRAGPRRSSRACRRRGRHRASLRRPIPGAGRDRARAADGRPAYVALAADHPLAAKPRAAHGRPQRRDLDRGPRAGSSSRCADAAHAAGFEPRSASSRRSGSASRARGRRRRRDADPDVALATVREDIVLRSLGPDAPRAQS